MESSGRCERRAGSGRRGEAVSFATASFVSARAKPAERSVSAPSATVPAPRGNPAIQSEQ